MTDQTPGSPADLATIDLHTIKMGQIKLEQRMQALDATILKILQLFKRGEEAFEVRVSRVLSNAFKGIAHDLDHSIEDYSKAISQLERGFDIYLVDGETVKENEKTIQVTKREDGGFDFALASDPETLLNEGTEPFAQWFAENPAVMGERNEVLVNIIAYTTKAQAEKPADETA